MNLRNSTVTIQRRDYQERRPPARGGDLTNDLLNYNKNSTNIYFSYRVYHTDEDYSSHWNLVIARSRRLLTSISQISRALLYTIITQFVINLHDNPIRLDLQFAKRDSSDKAQIN